MQCGLERLNQLGAVQSQAICVRPQGRDGAKQTGEAVEPTLFQRAQMVGLHQ
jgi:hypothetical protein